MQQFGIGQKVRYTGTTSYTTPDKKVQNEIAVVKDYYPDTGCYVLLLDKRRPDTNEIINMDQVAFVSKGDLACGCKHIDEIL